MEKATKKPSANGNGKAVSAAPLPEIMIEKDAQVEAINQAFAVIEFDAQGNILYANDIFLEATGYSLDEIEGKHHRIFVSNSFAKSPEYKTFWKDLAGGKAKSGAFERYNKTGDIVWLQASYVPVLDNKGSVEKVVKIAMDITESKEQANDNISQVEAIGKSNAVIEFSMDGNVVYANDNFLKTFGYKLNEIKGKHHSMFCKSSYTNSEEYKIFWRDLNKGLFQSGEFMRIGKDGKEIWIQATYNPILDLKGDPYKVVKYAMDITAQKELEQEAQAATEELRAQEEELRQSMEEMTATQEEMRRKEIEMESQMQAINTTSAFIEFEPDGTVIRANDLFLEAMGYNMDQIEGKHHRIFCDTEYTKTREYTQFWEELAAGKPQQGEFKRITRSGDEIWLLANYTPVMNQQQEVVKVIKLASDITTSKHNELAFKKVMEAIGEITNGNFDFDIDYGKLKVDDSLVAVASDMARLRDNLKGILEEVNQVITLAGEEGQLDARLNMKVEGEWKALTDSINLLLQSVADPLLEFNAIIGEMAKGDLTKKFEMNVAGDVKKMAVSLNLAIDNLNELLGNIEKNADTVGDSSESLLKKSESIKNNSNEVASAITQMAKGAQDQALRTDESSKLVEEVLKSANEMEVKADIINKTAESGQKSSDNGIKVMKTMVNNMEDISGSANKTSESIEILTKRAEEIARTLTVITDIASQTNLLALNAAIEAARAGDAGRGFAVVAEEIRKLAEDSRKSAVDIEQIIGDVQKDTAAASKAIESMQGSVKNGNEATKSAETIFNEIAMSSEETFNHSKEIQNGSIKQKEAIEAVVKNIEQIVVVAEETAAGTQQVASSSQELNTSMESITDASERLASIADELKAGISKFNLSK